ncbi:MAG: preprotein translocase subunit YajC [Planctomycetota bacterium]|nr:preprotein translocase subunit YajC [Planctomycetota bacterium]
MILTLKILAFDLHWFLVGQVVDGAAKPAAENGAKPPDNTSFMIMMFGMLAVFYFMMFRRSRKRKQQQSQKMDDLKMYCEITTIGGLCGTVVNIEDTTDDKGNESISHVTIETDSETQSRIRIVREAIGQIVSSDDETADEK